MTAKPLLPSAGSILGSATSTAPEGPCAQQSAGTPGQPGNADMPGEHDSAGQAADDTWQVLEFVVPSGAVDVIEAELARIIELCGWQDIEPATARGLALELMAANSDGIPLSSLE